MANKYSELGELVLNRGDDAVDPIIEAVREKFLTRSKVGINKYGVGLDRTDLTTLEWLQHAQEEAMDLAGYLEVLIQKEMLNKE